MSSSSSKSKSLSKKRKNEEGSFLEKYPAFYILIASLFVFIKGVVYYLIVYPLSNGLFDNPVIFISLFKGIFELAILMIFYSILDTILLQYNHSLTKLLLKNLFAYSYIVCLISSFLALDFVIIYNNGGIGLNDLIWSFSESLIAPLTIIFILILTLFKHDLVNS